ncbi:MAG TPA: hypothetical protein DCM86_10815 [Verrucomicrobiales bacterium]|nr:hypothetical protein [Verrucomicrobiales bacterium]
MKKIVLRVAIGLVVLLVVGIVVFAMFLDGIVKKGVETVGPVITKTEIKLAGVSISILGGSANLKGFTLGNPDGYKSPTAIEADTVSVQLNPSSILSDKVVIKSVRLDGARISVEGGPNDNNLTKILANVESVAGGAGGTQPKEAPAGGAGKKLEVDDFLITNTKLSLTLKMLGGKTTTVSLPDVHLTNLGTGPEGITPAELVKRVLGAVTGDIGKVALDAVKNLGGAATDAVKDLGKTGAEGVNKATQGIKDLFKKK